jgi:hypothetical protein
LRTYLKYLYLEYPAYVRIFLNESEVDLKNPYSLLRSEHPNCFSIYKEKNDCFAGAFLEEEALNKELNKQF